MSSPFDQSANTPRTWAFFFLLLAGLAAVFTVDDLGGGAATVALYLASAFLVIGLGLLVAALRRDPAPTPGD